MEADQRLQLRLKQEADRADRLRRPVAGRFIALAEEPLARHEAKQHGLAVTLDGGWPEAERLQVCFHEAGEEPVFTHVWLCVNWNGRFAAASHGDLLGSLMGLGFDRSLFGDLVMQEDAAYLCALPEVASQLPEAWREAGRTPIRVSLMDEPPALKLPEGETIRDTVPSLRLDAVLSAGMRVSRAKAAEAIRAERVSVNHLPEIRPDRLLAQGDLISIRHFGRVRLKSVGESTKRDRLPVVLERFTHANR